VHSWNTYLCCKDHFRLRRHFFLQKRFIHLFWSTLFCLGTVATF
jgi:hypothetical protein